MTVKLSDEVRSSFMFLRDDEWQSSARASVEGAEPWLVEAAAAFIDNLKSAVIVGSLPFTQAFAAFQDAVYTRMSLAERLRAKAEAVRTADDPGEDALANQAREIAQRKFQEYVASTESNEELSESLERSLGGLLKRPDTAEAPSELLRQVAVLTWGALEVVFTDVLTGLLNSRPGLAHILQSEDPVKKYFTRRVTFDALAAAGFDLSRTMGTHLFKHVRLDDLKTMRIVADALFVEAGDFCELLSTDTIKRLEQQRHLIVHRRAVVDAQYCQRSGDTSPELGSRLVVRSGDVKAFMDAVQEIGFMLLETVARQRVRHAL